MTLAHDAEPVLHDLAERRDDATYQWIKLRDMADWTIGCIDADGSWWTFHQSGWFDPDEVEAYGPVIPTYRGEYG